jgi:hypothetical protein
MRFVERVGYPMSVSGADQLNPHMLQVRKEYIQFGLAKWGLLFVERGVKIAVVERGVSPTDRQSTPQSSE